MKPTDPPPDLDPAAADRLRHWQRRLGRLRLGVEPLEEQLARYRRVTLALTAIPLGIGLMFVSLFIAFNQPMIGLTVAAVILLPIVALAWLDFLLLSRRASAYLREQQEIDRHRPPSPPGPP